MSKGCLGAKREVSCEKISGGVRGQRTGLVWGHLGVRERSSMPRRLWPADTGGVVGHGEGG